MLALTRKVGETIGIGPDIFVEVLDIDYKQRRVRLGITAPRGVLILRTELAGSDAEQALRNRCETTTGVMTEAD